MATMVALPILAGSPVVAASSAAEEPGPHRPVSATFGDCKNQNTGKHNGYDCPTVQTTTGGTYTLS